MDWIKKPPPPRRCPQPSLLHGNGRADGGTASVWGHINSDYTLACAHTQTHILRKATPSYFEPGSSKIKEWQMATRSHENVEVIA